MAWLIPLAQALCRRMTRRCRLPLSMLLLLLLSDSSTVHSLARSWRPSIRIPSWPLLLLLLLLIAMRLMVVPLMYRPNVTDSFGIRCCAGGRRVDSSLRLRLQLLSGDAGRCASVVVQMLRLLVLLLHLQLLVLMLILGVIVILCGVLSRILLRVAERGKD